jgi:hypothetical protein
MNSLKWIWPFPSLSTTSKSFFFRNAKSACLRIAGSTVQGLFAFAASLDKVLNMRFGPAGVVAKEDPAGVVAKEDGCTLLLIDPGLCPVGVVGVYFGGGLGAGL